MATPEALTSVYRRRLVGQQLSLLHAVTGAWGRMVDPTAIDATFPAFAATVVPLTTAMQRQVGTAALGYLAGYVSAADGGPIHLPAVDPTAHVGVMADAVPIGQRLDYARVAVKQRAADGWPLEQSAASAVAVAREVTSNALMSAARLTLADGMRLDARVIGWQRVTSPRCCGFCGMLASRGPVYNLETVRFRAHSHCTCTAEPVVKDVPVKRRQAPTFPPPSPAEIAAAVATAAHQVTGSWSGKKFNVALADQRRQIAA